MSSILRARVTRPHLAALLLLTGTSALSTDAYIASLPAVRTTLHTSSAVAQLTMTAFIAGTAVGQLLSGPISDARGRRRPIIGATVVFTVMAALCAVATSGWLLVAERAVRGLAAGTALAVGRAVVNDTSRGRAAAALFGTLSAVSLIAPVVAPAIGGALVLTGTWRTVFWFLALVGVAMWVGAVVGLPETLPPERRQPGGFVQMGRRTRDLLTDRAFRSPVVVQCLTSAGFFVYIGGSSFVLQEDLGLSVHAYTLVFTGNAIAMVATSWAFRLLVHRVGPFPLRRVAIPTQTAGVALLLAVVLLAPGHRPPLPLVWVPLAIMTAGLGLFLPSNSAIAQAAGRRSAGTASALGGGLPFLTGSLTTPLTGALGRETVLTMASLMAVFFALAALTAFRLRGATRADDVDDVPADGSAEETLVPA